MNSSPIAAEPDTSIANNIAMPRYSTVSATPLLYALPLGVKPMMMSSAKYVPNMPSMKISECAKLISRRTPNTRV